MILISSNPNNTLLYNAFHDYIDKYINTSQNEEFIRNYSYRQIAVLKLYCAFNIVERIYNLSLLEDLDGDPLYTEEALFSNYNILSLAAELQKVDININDILDLFTFTSSIRTDLLAFRNKYNDLSRLNKLITTPTIQTEQENIVNTVNTLPSYYEFSTGALTKNVTKTITHSQNLTKYFINVRSVDGNNNVAVSTLKKNASDPKNAVDIKVGLDIGAPGLIIQIIGI